MTKQFTLGQALICASILAGGILASSRSSVVVEQRIGQSVEPPLAAAIDLPEPRNEDERLLLGRVRAWANDAAERRLAETIQEADRQATPEGIASIVQGGKVQGALATMLLALIVKIVMAAIAAVVLSVLWTLLKPYILKALLVALIWTLLWAGVLDGFWALLGMLRRPKAA
jgi:hypothetical protein